MLNSFYGYTFSASEEIYVHILFAFPVQIGNHLGWRWAFYIEAIAMAVFVVLSFCIKPPQQLKGDTRCFLIFIA